MGGWVGGGAVAMFVCCYVFVSCSVHKKQKHNPVT